jgi:hypothetical protein
MGTFWLILGVEHDGYSTNQEISSFMEPKGSFPPAASFQIHYSLIILSFDTALSFQLKALLNKSGIKCHS